MTIFFLALTRAWNKIIENRAITFSFQTFPRQTRRVFSRRGPFILRQYSVSSKAACGFFFNRVQKLWNSLTPHFLEISSLSMFKSSIARIDLSRYKFFLFFCESILSILLIFDFYCYSKLNWIKHRYSTRSRFLLEVAFQ